MLEHPSLQELGLVGNIRLVIKIVLKELFQVSRQKYGRDSEDVDPEQKVKAVF